MLTHKDLFRFWQPPTCLDTFRTRENPKDETSTSRLKVQPHSLMGQRRPALDPQPLQIWSQATFSRCGLPARTLTTSCPQSPSPLPSPARSASPGAAPRPRSTRGPRHSPGAGARPAGQGCWRAGCRCRSRSRTPGSGWSGSAEPRPCRRPRPPPAGTAPRCRGRCVRAGTGLMSPKARPAAWAPASRAHVPGGRAPARLLPLGQATSGQMESGRKWHCWPRGRPWKATSPGWGGKRNHEGHARVPLTRWAAWPPRTPRRWWCADSGLCWALPRGHPPPYPSYTQAEQGDPVSPPPLGAVAAPSPCAATLPPECTRHGAPGPLQARGSRPVTPPPAVTPRTPRGRASSEKPRECHPPPSPEGTASPRRWAKPQAAGRRSRTGRDGHFCPLQRLEGLDRRGGHALSVHARL